MKFAQVPLATAEGSILAHTLRAGPRILKKGRVLEAADIAALSAAGCDEVMAARLEPGDVGEDRVAGMLAAAIGGAGVRVAPAKTGRANLFASVPGLARIDAARIDALNAVDPSVTVATLVPLAPLRAGEMLATVKVIPFAVPGAVLARCLAVLAEPACGVWPFQARRAALILTTLEGQPPGRVVQASRAVGQRLSALGVTLVHEQRCHHDERALRAALDEVLALDVELVLVLGASAIVDPRDVIPAAIVAVGGAIEHFGMPVDPGNLILLASHQARGTRIEVIGVPSCARSPKRSGFDIVLERIVAGLSCGSREVMAMGVGGLLPEIPSRPGPRDEAFAPERPRRTAGLVLAAGSSRRMGATNKLLVPIEGLPMVARVVSTVLAAGLSEVVVVTGHEAAEVRAALPAQGLCFVHNPDYAQGLATSLKAGVAALGDEVDSVIVCLGDMPWVHVETIGALVAAAEDNEGARICVPMFEGKRGNPVLWGRRYFSEILALSGDTGAREVLARHREDVIAVPVDDPGILLDVDTEEALKALVTN